ncbi:copper radical oxidase [Plenodomus tracheiphilus IPT5]|uniref:Copper radical oxidase n=1 Tax=Plenodomus tracheiphilus IPT5 TaxID=1408161 RepID=A0A6A7BDM7_9PLEO|nr:copper radical oxidase [Plenodomus tracheiphilus IPT5]
MPFANKAALANIALQFCYATTLAQGGSWSAVIDLPIIPVAAYVVPEYPSASRLMFYSAWSPNSFGQERGFTQFADFNYVTGAVSQREVSETKHDMFCPGMNSLADGRLIITGGSNAEKTTLYDPRSNTFAPGPDMKIPRGYQSSSILSNGKVFTIGGSWSGARGGKTGEIYDPAANTWRILPSAAVEPMLTNDNGGIFHSDNHAWLFPWRNGSVFQAGPSKAMHWYFTDGEGGVTPAGTRDPVNDAMCGVNVMYDVGRIFTAGGANSYGDAPGLSVAHLIEINEVGAPATITNLPDMKYKRAFANAVVLPDGKILITGGQQYAKGFTDWEPVFAPELFDPATKDFTELAPEAIPRNYQSVSILLADGRVFSGGGGLCYDDGTGTVSAPCHSTVDHPNGQIFTPPYLTTNSPRPVISNLVASTVAPGGELRVTMEGSAEGVTFSLIRIGSVTHNINTDQRRVPLTPTAAAGEIVLPILADRGVMLLGAWYLFAISAQGVPSVARTIYVQ